MAQYSRDFSEYSIDQDPLAVDWTRTRSDTLAVNDPDSRVVADARGPAGRAWRIGNTVIDSRCYALTPATIHGHWEIYMEVAADAALSMNEWSVGSAGRIGGSDGALNAFVGYMLRFGSTTYRRSVASYAASAFTAHSTSSSVTLTEIDRKRSFLMQIEPVGADINLRFKEWFTGDAEPGWSRDVTIQAPELADGKPGWFQTRHGDFSYLFYFGAGSNGDAAPRPSAVSPPAGTVTISDVNPDVTTAVVTYSYDDIDEDLFEYRIDNGTEAVIGASPATITGLTAETVYNSPGVQVRAVNAGGDGAWSTAVPFTTLAAGNSPAGTVTIDTVTPDKTSAFIEFSYNDTDQTGFEYRLNNGTPVDIGDPSPLEFTIPGLDPETAYNSPGVEVRAYNTSGESAWSTASPFTTLALEKTVTVQLVGEAANLTNLRWAFFDSPDVHLWAAPVDTGNTGTTDGSGIFSVFVPNSTLTNGQIGYLYITDNNGTVVESYHHGSPIAVLVD